LNQRDVPGWRDGLLLEIGEEMFHPVEVDVLLANFAGNLRLTLHLLRIRQIVSERIVESQAQNPLRLRDVVEYLLRCWAVRQLIFILLAREHYSWVRKRFHLERNEDTRRDGKDVFPIEFAAVVARLHEDQEWFIDDIDDPQESAEHVLSL
jgi:hypothetical protein